jgi:hypothetical protein
MNGGIQEKTPEKSNKNNGELKDGFDSRTRYHLLLTG